MGQFGKYWLGVGLLLAGAATINTLMAAVPRILYGMALDGALPRMFAYLHPRFKTPVVGILVAVLIPAYTPSPFRATLTGSFRWCWRRCAPGVWPTCW